MDELGNLFACRDILLDLVEHVVANRAVLGNDLAFGRLVFAVMAPETPRRIEVADIVRIGVPLNLHGREEIALIDAFTCYCLVDGRRLLLGNLRIILDIIGRNLGGDGGEALLLGLVGLVQDLDSDLFDVGQPAVDVARTRSSGPSPRWANGKCRVGLL